MLPRRLGESPRSTSRAHALGGELARRLRSATMSGELRRGVAAGTLIFAVGVVVRTLSEVIFARLMGPREFGAYSYLFAWLSILAVAGGLGIPYALVRFVPEYEVLEKPRAQLRLARFARAIALVSGCALAVAGTGAILLVAPRGVSAGAIVLSMACVPLLALFTVQSELARGFRRVVLAYLPLLVLRPALTVAIAGLILLASGSLSAQQGLAAGLLAVVLGLLAQRSRVSRLLDATRASPRGARDASTKSDSETAERRVWLSVALPLLAINLLAAVAMRADVIVVGALRGSEAAGVYAVAARVALLSTFALEALNTIVAPTLARLYFAGDIDAVRRLVRRAARVTLGCAVLATLLLELAGTRSLQVFGSGYSCGMTALQVLLIGQLVSASTGPVIYLMIATGEQNLAAIAQAATTALFVISAIPLTAYWGFVGTAAAVTLARASVNIWMAVAAQRRLGVRAFVF